MDSVMFLKALTLGVVEGLTEFLPVSSTSHLILVGDLLKFNDERAKVFDIVIQMGAILAVVWNYRSRLGWAIKGLGRDGNANRFWLNFIIAFIPLATIGLLYGKQIRAALFSPIPVALAFISGGLVILWAEKRRHIVRVETVDGVSPPDALKLGLAQALALIPGASRSGATIIGGLFFGLSRKAATEFSFFLAVPTLGAGSFYELYKAHRVFDVSYLGVLAVGFVAAFISAAFSIKALIRYISNHDFTVFAWYRIVFGGLVLLTAYTHVVNWSQV
jgi:undecaprenyl-diphosphatase